MRRTTEVMAGWRALAGCALGLVLAGCAPPAEEFSTGAALYRTYCASCHGIAARGDGPVAAALKKQPPDLTAIAPPDQEFPRVLIGMIVDGRYTAHGDREMPVWGGRLRDEEIRAVADYIAGLQE